MPNASSSLVPGRADVGHAKYAEDVRQRIVRRMNDVAAPAARPAMRRPPFGRSSSIGLPTGRRIQRSAFSVQHSTCKMRPQTFAIAVGTAAVLLAAAPCPVGGWSQRRDSRLRGSAPQATRWAAAPTAQSCAADGGETEADVRRTRLDFRIIGRQRSIGIRAEHRAGAASPGSTGRPTPDALAAAVHQRRQGVLRRDGLHRTPTWTRDERLSGQGTVILATRDGGRVDARAGRRPAAGAMKARWANAPTSPCSARPRVGRHGRLHRRASCDRRRRSWASPLRHSTLSLPIFSVALRAPRDDRRRRHSKGRRSRTRRQRRRRQLACHQRTRRIPVAHGSRGDEILGSPCPVRADLSMTGARQPIGGRISTTFAFAPTARAGWGRRRTHREVDGLVRATMRMNRTSWLG